MPNAKTRFLLASLIVALLAGLLFTPGLPGEFVFDDYPNIVNNPVIQATRLDDLIETALAPQPSGALRVLPTVSFALDHWRAGRIDPATFKATNIILHGLTACLLAWLFRGLLLVAGTAQPQVRWLAPALALAWAVHPLQVSAVLYVVQRMQTMGTMFLVVALLAYVQARRSQIAGRAGSVGFLTAILAWLLAMGCKEDSVLLPAYTLALELTVLRFAAAAERETRLLRRAYLFVSLAGTAVFLLVVVPRHWSWDAYSGRNFSTLERLLTQGRVLWMYLGQIVLPLPSRMPFFYDWVQPSRTLLQPLTTLPALLGLLGLLGAAVWQRTRQPLFALGVFLFFAAHFITSNVIALELAYEHRNHFALIGAVLAIGSLLARAADRLELRDAVRKSAIGLVLVALGVGTVLRAQDWRDTLHLAQAASNAAPGSARAWIELCAKHYELGGGPIQANTRLNEAINACSQGATHVPDSLNSPALLIVLKTLRGDVTAADWEAFRQRMRTSSRSWDNYRAPMLLSYNMVKGVKLDKEEMLKVFSTQDLTSDLTPSHLAGIGYFVMNDLGAPDQAMHYFIKAMAAIPPNDPFPQQLATELRAKGRPDLARVVAEAKGAVGR